MDEPPRPFPLARTVALVALAWGALAWPWLSGAVTIPWDGKAHWYPHLGFVAAALRSGAGLAWTPGVFSGSPEIADPQSVLFSVPLMALALIDPAPSLAALDRAVFAALLAGGLGIVLLFRDRGWHWGGALVAAIAFAFGASAAWRVQHLGQIVSLAWWPLAWWLLERALRRGSMAHGAAAGLAAGLMVIGRDQVAVLAVYLLAGAVLAHWLAATDRRAAFRASLLPLAAGLVAGALVVAVPILFSALWAAESNRVAIDLEGAGRGSLHPGHLLTLAIGNLYGAAGPLADHWGPPSPRWEGTGLFLARNMGVVYAGAAPLLLVLAALRTGAAFAPGIRYVTVALGLMLLYALGWHTPAFALFWHLPGVAFFRRPADATFLVGGLFAVIAGYAAHLLLTGRLATSWRVETLVAALMLAAGAALIVAKQAPPAAWTALAVAAATLALSLGALTVIPRRWLALPLAVLLAADLAVTNGPSESTALPPATYEVLTPQSRNATLAAVKALVVRDGARRDRVELIGLGYPWQNAAMVHGLDDVLGFNPVRSAAYAGLVGAEDIAALPGQRRFPPAFPSYRSVLADILGLRYLVAGAPAEAIDKALPPGALTLVARTDEGFIYENPRALPRVWIAPQAAQTPPDLAAAGFPPGLDPRQTVLLEGPLPAPRAAGGSARLAAYANTAVTVETDSPEGGVLVLADAWHPWWRAEIDGRPVRVRRAYGLVRAVEVPAGRATVRFAFRPLAGALDQLRGR